MTFIDINLFNYAESQGVPVSLCVDKQASLDNKDYASENVRSKTK